MSISLIESKRTSRKSVRSTMVSIALHAAVITVAVYATANAHEVIPATVADTTHIVFVAGDPALKTHHASHTSAASNTQPPARTRRLTFSPAIPTTVVPNVSTPFDSLDDRGLFGTLKSSASSTFGIDASTGSDAAYDSRQVDKPALPRAGNPFPKYPSLLLSSRIEGSVLAEFVVDTLGRADMRTLKILDSSNDLFSESLRVSLAEWRFYPAEAGGHRVKQIVQLPLKFIAPNH